MILVLIYQFVERAFDGAREKATIHCAKDARALQRSIRAGLALFRHCPARAAGGGRISWCCMYMYIYNLKPCHQCQERRESILIDVLLTLAAAARDVCLAALSSIQCGMPAWRAWQF